LIKEIPIVGHRRATSVPQAQAPESLAFAVFGPDLATAVTSGFGDQLLVWDLRAGRPVRTFPLEGYAGASLAVSPDGRLLAAAVTLMSTDQIDRPTAKSDASIRIWEVMTKRELLRFEPHARETWPLAFSPDGKTLVSGANDTTATVWDTSPAFDGLKPSPDGR
jgi:WD40 repeat protein